MSTLTIAQASCADDYDPNSMPVAKARAFIHQFLDPVTGILRMPVRTALGRVLAEDVLTPVDVPAHRNSAMDGWALRSADLKEGESVVTEIGSSFAGRPFGGPVGAGQCVRIMTGGVVPEGADLVVMQERARASGKSIAIAPGQKAGQNVREAGEDLKAGIRRAAQGSRQSAPPSWASSPRSASARWRCIGRCAWRSSPPATSSSPSARR